ncbi:hypothetical protein J6590_073890 [Homalodisca vitripennis]|nr:hypothetical protein J6590_073890 [Homalodisca vitripennis]
MVLTKLETIAVLRLDHKKFRSPKRTSVAVGNWEIEKERYAIIAQFTVQLEKHMIRILADSRNNLAK